MIRIRTARNGRWTIRMTGHANAAPHGEDIVCAAVSALAINTANALEAVAKVPMQAMETEAKEGYFTLSLDPTNLAPDVRRDADVLFQAFCLGIRSTAEAYSEYLHYDEGV